MNFFIEVCLSNALVATGLALVIAVVSRLFRRPVLSHALWVVVVLKLVSPPLFRIPVAWQSPPPVSDSVDDSVAYASRSATLELTDVELAELGTGDEPPVELAWAALSEPSDGDAASSVFLTAQDGEGKIGYSSLFPNLFSSLGGRLFEWSGWRDWWSVRAIGFGWLAGSCAWFTLAVARLWRFHQLLSLGRAGSAALQARSREIALRLGIRVIPEVWLVPGRISPLLWSIGGRAKLVLPEALLASLDVEQLDSLIVHEMAHARRLDHWVRWLEFFALGIYWWHPVVWWARWEIRQAEEACCDAWVVAARPGNARAYAEALVETVGFLTGARKALPPLASGIGHVQHLRRRLTMILHSEPTQPKSWRAYAGSLMLALMVLPVAPYQGKGPTVGDGDEKSQASQEPNRRDVEHRLQALEAKMDRLLNALESGDGANRKAGTLEKLTQAQNEERRAQAKAAAEAAKAQSAAASAQQEARAAAADAAKKARQNAEHAKRAAEEALKHADAIDGGELGRKIGEAIRQSFDPDRMADLGRQIGEAVNSGVDPARMEELGRQIEEAVRKAVDSKEFEDLGRQIEEAVNKNLDPKRMQELEKQIEEAVSKAVDSDLFEELGRSIEAIMEKSGGKEVVIERKKEKEKVKPPVDEKAAKAPKMKTANPPAKPKDEVEGRIRSLEEKMDRVIKALESRTSN